MAIPIPNQDTSFTPQAVDLGANIEQQTGDILSKAASDVGHAALSGAKEISTDRMMNQVNEYNGEVNKARVSIITNPSPSNIAAQQQRVASGAGVSKGVPVLGSDQPLLNRSIESSENSFNLAAANKLGAITKRQQYIEFQTGYPQSVQEIHQQAAQGNISVAGGMAQKLSEQVDSLVATGVLPPMTQVRTNALIKTTLERSHDLFTRGAADAADPVKAAYNEQFPFSSNTKSQLQQPSVEFKYNSIINGQNLNDAKQDAINGKLPTGFLTNPKVSQADYNHVMGVYQGSTYTRAHIKAGMPYAMMQAEQKNLNSKKIVLTSQEEGIRDALTLANNQIKTNYFKHFTTDTNAGREALDEHNQQLVALNQSDLLTPAEKAEKAQESDKQFRQSAIAHGQTLGVPAKYIKPFPSNSPEVLNTQQSFSPSADVQPAINVLRNAGVSAPYVSGSMGTATQQETAHMVSMAPEAKGAVLLMHANQNQEAGTASKVLDGDGKPIPDKTLTTALYSSDNVSKYLNFIRKLPGGVTRVAAAQKSLMNGMKYCLRNNTDNSTSDCASYLGQNTVPNDSEYESGSTDGADYHFLNAELGGQPLVKNDAEAVSSYVSNMAYDSIKKQVAPDGNLKKLATVDSRKIVNPLQVMNTPDGQIVAFDKQTGQTVYHTQLTPALIATARSRLLALTQAKSAERKRLTSVHLPLYKAFSNTVALEEKKQKHIEELNQLGAANATKLRK